MIRHLEVKSGARLLLGIVPFPPDKHWALASNGLSIREELQGPKVRYGLDVFLAVDVRKIVEAGPVHERVCRSVDRRRQGGTSWEVFRRRAQ